MILTEILHFQNMELVERPVLPSLSRAFFPLFTYRLPLQNERVCEGAGDGDGASKDSLGIHGRLEDEDRGEDYDDALDGVANGVRDGRD